MWFKRKHHLLTPDMIKNARKGDRINAICRAEITWDGYIDKTPDKVNCNECWTVLYMSYHRLLGKVQVLADTANANDKLIRAMDAAMDRAWDQLPEPYYQCCDHCPDTDSHPVDKHTCECNEINCDRGTRLVPPKGMPF